MIPKLGLLLALTGLFRYRPVAVELGLIALDWGIGIMRRLGSYRFVNGGSNMPNHTSMIVLKLNLDGTLPEGVRV